jgi:4-amino-4-deoxy-L-arabinose transferase-like glycosyltransferase
MSALSPETALHRPGAQAPAPATSAGGGRDRLARLWRGPAEDPRWARPSLLGVLVATAVMYIWNLSSSGWANSFYSAAVQAGTKSWKAMLFGSLDASNAITVDKPPASLWLMEISGRLFGFGSFTMLLPEALLGVATVAVVYASVKRVVGPGFGLFAAAATALTPVAVLMFRFNNPDALLVFLLTLAVYAVLRAQENGSTRWLVLAGALVGFAFLTKTLQAFLILPALTAVYLATGPGKFVRRIWQLLASGLAMVVSAGWWVAIVQLTPAADRPYIGGSQKNSFLELTFGYNGFGRITGDEVGSVSGPQRGTGGAGAGLPQGLREAFANGSGRGGPGGGGGFGGGPGGGGGFSSGTGLLRMFDQEIGTQASWLIPGALIVFAAGLWAAGRAARTDRPRAALLGWGLSLLSTMAVFSFMQGIFHPYYTIALAPLIGATVAIGAGMLWRRRAEWVARGALAVAIGATGWWAWELLERTPAWTPWIKYAVVFMAGVGAAAMAIVGGVGAERVGAVARRDAQAEDSAAIAPADDSDVPEWVRANSVPSRPVGASGAAAGAASGGATADVGPAASAASTPSSTQSVPPFVRWVVVALGVGAALLGPVGYAMATVSTGHTGSIPSAGPSGGGFGGGPGGGGFRGGGGGFGGGFPGGTTGGQNGTGQNGFPGGGFPGGTTGGRNGFPGGGFPGGTTGGTTGQNGGTTGGTTGQTPGGQNGGGLGGLLDASTPSAQVKALLLQDAKQYKWVAAAIGAQNAAGPQLATGYPVMAVGGFNGSDPSPTLAQFQTYVAKHQIHYYLGGGIGQGSSDISSWVAAHYTAQTVDGVTLYDLTQTPKA